jgi:hypothetical protein
MARVRATGKEAEYRRFMNFISSLSGLVSEHSARELIDYRKLARRSFPSLVPIVDSLLYVTDIEQRRSGGLLQHEASARARPLNYVNGDVSSPPRHLFDLLRSKELFPTNSELALFAASVLPGMTRKRFDKMSRADIAARIIEYLETLNIEKKRRLEESMRNAIQTKSSSRRDRQSFFAVWEGIIKGAEL